MEKDSIVLPNPILIPNQGWHGFLHQRFNLLLVLCGYGGGASPYTFEDVGPHKSNGGPWVVGPIVGKEVFLN